MSDLLSTRAVSAAARAWMLPEGREGSSPDVSSTCR